ncbi:MAG TPA: 50S ribosomal protein L29 [Nitrospiria bacterium]|nr:50S ribosomal protein L29 [Nitrospiria bacterium]HUK57552.1 50S ribosomal protein L29 [Nitrospiria bacterium]
MELQEMRNLTIDELNLKEKELRKELFNLRYQLLSGRIENPQQIKNARREIARIQTVVCEKRSAASKTAA